jgi:hypothetical protein
MFKNLHSRGIFNYRVSKQLRISNKFVSSFYNLDFRVIRFDF